MARVRCSCGRSYTIPDQHIGRRVTCAACKRTFVAAALPESAPPPATEPRPAPKPKPAPKRTAAPARPLIGDMAVARGYMTHEQLDACIEYQEGVHKTPPLDNLKLGRILLTRRLLTKPQVRQLVEEQTVGSPEAVGATAAAEAIAEKRKSYGQAVTAEQREAVRKQVEAAEKRHAEKQKIVRSQAALIEPSRIHGSHVLLALLVVVGAILVVALWPAPAAERTLVAYLQSSDETSVTPDASLALIDLQLAVRRFSDLSMEEGAAYDYTTELEAYGKLEKKSDGWSDFIATAGMPPPKVAALGLILRALPDTLTPTKAGELRITVQPITCQLVFHPRGMGEDREGRYRFTMAKVRSPHWSCGWKVAAFGPVVGKR